jgi:putative DNA primase/helicase
MTFLDFCRAHGILIDSVPPIGIWRRYATADHPRKRNGAVKFMGDVAFVQNHATDTTVSVWRSEVTVQVDRQRIARIAAQADEEQRQRQEQAAQRAAWILDQTLLCEHEYLRNKGFDKMVGNVWVREGVPLLVIPMRVGASLVGCQLIDPEGGKRFLAGQRTSDASHTFDNRGPDILCEGYATGLAIRLALSGLHRKFRIHVCFSAGNMLKIAARLPSGFVVADNDASGTGERVAQQIGWPYWMSDQQGEDAHDAWKRLGQFRFASSLIRSMHR